LAAEPESGTTNTISFSKQIAPILERKCLTCHGPEKAKGGLQLHTFERLRQGGESKEPTITPGHPEQSKLYQLLVTKDPDDRMPQKDDPLPADQIKLFARWIQEGAAFDGPDAKAPLTALRPPVTHPPPPTSYPRPVPITALDFRPDGQALAVAGYHEVTIWNPSNGVLLARVTNVDQQTLALADSPDGTLLAVGGGTPGRSGDARVFEAATGRLLQTLVTVGDLVLAVAFSPDGRHLAVGGADNVIRLFQLPSGQEERKIEQHADWVMALAFSPDGTRLVSGSRDKSVRLFDPQTGDLEETYTGHSQAIFAVGFLRDGKSLISGGRDKALHVWQQKEAKKSFEVPGFEADVWRLVVHSNQFFTASADQQVRVYRLGDKKAELVHTLQGHHDVVYSLAFHAASGRLASGSYDGEVRIWNATDGTLLNSFLAAPGYQPRPAESAPAPAGKKSPKRPTRAGSGTSNGSPAAVR
jgi:WD40 repeat protein